MHGGGDLVARYNAGGVGYSMIGNFDAVQFILGTRAYW